MLKHIPCSLDTISNDFNPYELLKEAKKSQVMQYVYQSLRGHKKNLCATEFTRAIRN